MGWTYAPWSAPFLGVALRLLDHVPIERVVRPKLNVSSAIVGMVGWLGRLAPWHGDTRFRG